MELNPEYTPEALLRAVRQAVSCAKAATAPFLAVAVLPAWDDSPFSRVLARHPECCHALVRLPAGFFHFDRPEYAPQSRGPGRQGARESASFGVNIWLIHNQAGLQEYLRRDAFEPLRRAVIACLLYTSPSPRD